MTEETKKFIELSDVLSLRLECRHCGSGLSISSCRDMMRREEQGKLSNCPVCGREWASIGGSSCEMTIAQFVDCLNKLRGTLKSFPAGFLLTLEIKNERKPQVDIA
jgi:transcription elongation factor Elf1